MVTASGEKLKLLGESNVKVTIIWISFGFGGTAVDSGRLLGTDFLSQYGCVVDLLQHVIIAGGKDVPMVDRSKRMDNSLICFVSTSESVEFQHHARCVSQQLFLDSHGQFLRLV